MSISSRVDITGYMKMSGSRPRLNTSIPTIEAIGVEINIANKHVKGGINIKYGKCSNETRPNAEFNINDIVPMAKVSKKVNEKIALIRE